MKRMVVVGTVTDSKLNDSAPKKLRVFRLDNNAVKDIPLESLLPVAERLGVLNIDDFKDTAVSALYTRYYCGAAPKIVSGADSCFVLGTHGNGGYVCIRPHIANDFIRVIPRSRLVQDVKKGRMRLVNAVVEQTPLHDVVSPFSGEWDDASHLFGRELAQGSAENEWAGNRVAVDKRDKIAAGDSVVSHDELVMLNDIQREFLKDYYIDYSTEAFNRIASTTAWKLKAGKTEKIVELRKLSGGESWRFAGLWDAGRFGAAKCEMGHKLRYVYMACPASKDYRTALNDGTLLRFGIVCHADFLEIPREDVARLSKLQDTMCDEIGFISTVCANNKVEEHYSLMDSLMKLMNRLAANNMLHTIVGDRLANAFKGFVDNNIPLVESIVLDIQYKLKEYGALRVLSAAGIDTSDFEISPQELYVIPESSETATQYNKKEYASRCRIAHQEGISKLYRTHESFFIALTRYAKMLIDNDICGEFMYIPTNEITDFRKRGAEMYKRYDHNDVALKYNETTRELRKHNMIYFTNHSFEKDYIPTCDGLKAQCLTIDGLLRLASFARRLKKAGENIEAALDTETIKAMGARLSELYFYGLSQYESIKPRLLMAVLPYTSLVEGAALLRRRCAQSVKSSQEILSLLDETSDCTSSEYIERIKAKFPLAKKEEIKQESGDNSQVVTTSAPLATAPASEPAQTISEREVNANTNADTNADTGVGNKTGYFQTSTTKKDYRGKPDEAKALVKTFNELYNKLPAGKKVDEYGIKVALDIIWRFEKQLGEKEGFTRKEKWRVENEIEQLKKIISF